MEGLKIRQATSSEVVGFRQWGIDEGWNMSSSDLPTYFAAYPEGWLIAQIGDIEVGKLYGTAYPSGLGHIGYIIVAKEWRGKGVGTALLRHCLDNYFTGSRLGVGLYSAAEELPFYKNLGFDVVQKVFRMTRTVVEGQSLGQGQSADHDRRYLVRDMDPNDVAEVEAVAQYDAKYSGTYRPRLWAHFPKSHVTLVLSTTNCGGEEVEEIVGVGALTPLEKSMRLAPIYAQSPSVAGTILKRLLNQFGSEGGGEVVLDTFSENEDALKLFQSAGFKTWNEAFLLLKPSAKGTNEASGQGKKMTYAGAVTPTSRSLPPQPPHPSAVNLSNIFGITSLAFN